MVQGYSGEELRHLNS